MCPAVAQCIYAARLLLLRCIASSAVYDCSAGMQLTSWVQLLVAGKLLLLVRCMLSVVMLACVALQVALVGLAY
jgi:hypothetical protein